MRLNNKSSLKYFYVGAKPEKAIMASSIREYQKPAGKEESEKKYFNPLFNFDKSFIDNLSKITQHELGSSQPHINLELMDLSGDVIENMTLGFFQKGIDLNSIGEGQRFADRPDMSLRSVDITTQLDSGYLYYTQVRLNIVIHKADYLTSNTLIGLLFPGMPLNLTYGWNSDNEFLNFKNKLLFSVSGYDLDIDEMGQINLSIDGFAYNEKISSILIGDTGEKEKDDLGIERSIKYLEIITNHIKDSAGREKKGTNNYETLTSQAEAYDNILTRAKGKISKNFSKSFTNLISKDNAYIQKAKLGKGSKEIEVIYFHDILNVLCEKTFQKIPDMIPGIKEFQIIYGTFNKNVIGDKKEKSIADFPINYKKFKEIIRSFQEQGQAAITIKTLIDELISEFIENKNYWLDQNTNPESSAEPEFHNDPDIVVNFSNNGEILQMSIIDAKANLPVPTIVALQGLTKASAKKAQDKILENFPDFPIVQLGHANSFIKKIKLGQVADPQMKALMIERMFKGSYLTRRESDNTVNAQTNNPVSAVVPVLPLQGSMSVIGHPGWLPFRAFFLSTGVFAIDAIYSITKVKHTLQREGYQTEIDFFWH